LVTAAAAPLVLMLVGAWSTAAGATGTGTSPCDQAPSPICGAALGPLRDVTSTWRWYQPSLVQPVPVSEYASDPEEAPPPIGVPAQNPEAKAQGTKAATFC
jgi:hypothetical protein